MADASAYLTVLDEAEAAILPSLTPLLEAESLRQLTSLRLSGQPAQPSPEYQRAVRDLLLNLWRTAIDGTLGLSLSDLGLKADPTQNILEEYARQFGARQISRIVNTSRDQIVREITFGQARGLSVAEVARNLQETIPRLAASRALTIATTESHGASQYASQRRAEQSGLILQKRWNSIRDSLVRDFGTSGKISQFNHRVMHGITIALSLNFQVPSLYGSTEGLLFPGDPRGSPGNIIHCRCHQTYVRRG